jgi:hypothetical protein
MIQQNITLCFTLACLAGLCHISGRAVVLKQVEREKRGLGTSRHEKLLSSLLFFVLECSAHVTYFFAPWFGPVSLVLPTEIASRLLFNVLILGGLLHHESFGKKELVGTAMVALAVVYLPITGPREPDHQDLLEIVTNPIALTWLGIVLVVYGTAVTLMLCLDLKRIQPCYTELILLAVAACSYLGNTVSKLASLAGDYGTLYSALLMGFGVLITVIWIIEVMNEPLYIRSFATYTPLNTGLGLVFSLLTGVSCSCCSCFGRERDIPKMMCVGATLVHGRRESKHSHNIDSSFFFHFSLLIYIALCLGGWCNCSLLAGLHSCLSSHGIGCVPHK